MAGHSLRDMIDRGSLNAAAGFAKPIAKPVAKAAPAAAAPAAPVAKKPAATGAAPVAKKAPAASPLAQHVANHLNDPVGSTQETFGNLSQKKLEYEQSKEDAKLKLAPVKRFIEVAENQHDLNEDEEEGYMEDPAMMQQQGPGGAGMGQPMRSPVPPAGTGLSRGGVTPPNMRQQPGNMMQQNKPGANVNVPGSGPAVNTKAPGMQAPAGKPTGQYNPPAPAASPKKVSTKKSGKEPGRSIKVHVAASSPGIRAAGIGLSQMQAGAAMSSLRASSGLSDNDIRNALAASLQETYGYGGGNGLVGSYPWIEAIFPFDKYFIYNLNSEKYRHDYKVTGDKFNLVGEPQRVRTKTTFIDAKGKTVIRFKKP